MADTCIEAVSDRAMSAPRAARRSTITQHTPIPTTPSTHLQKNAVTDRNTTPLPNPIDQTPKATPVQGAIIALGIVCGLLIFGILLFMLLFCHYRKKKMEHRVVARPPFIPRPFPQAGARSRMNEDPRNLAQQQQQQHVPEMPVGSRETHSAAAQRQGGFPAQSGRHSQMNGDDIETAQRQRAFSAQSGRHGQMHPGDIEAAQRQRVFSAQSARRSHMHEGMDMDAVAALAQRQRGPSAQSIRRSNLQEEIDLDTAAAHRQGAFSAQSARHSHLQGGDLPPGDMYGVYGSGLGGNAHGQGLPPMMTPQPFHHGDGFQVPMPDPVQIQRSGRDDYSVEDPHSDGDGRRNSRNLLGHPPPVSRQSRHSEFGDLGGRRGML